MSLFKTFKEMFDPNIHFQDYSQLTYDLWIKFKRMTPENDLFTRYDDLIESHLEYLYDNFDGYEPDWIEEYREHSLSYYDSMRFKITDKSEFKYDCLTFSNN